MSHSKEAVRGRAVETIDFPSEGELVFSPHYTVRVKALHARSVEVSVDGGQWQACRNADNYWWYDWTGYGSGAHVLSARIIREDGTPETLRPRAFRVALAPTGPAIQEGASTGSSNIAHGQWVLKNMDVQFVQLWFTDLSGKPWRISLPIDHFDDAAFTAGITLDGPSTSKSFPSFINLLPDPNAIFKDPLATVPTAAVICDLLEPKDAGSASVGVRQVLRNTVDTLGAIEHGLRATVGAEPEFFLMEQNGEPASEEHVWDFICDLARTLQDAGIRSEGFRFGPAKGQGRVQMRWTDPVRTADHVILYRWFARVLASRRNKVVTFHPKPGTSSAGAAGMMTHTSLWQGVTNAFHDENGWEFTSELCRHYAGGLVEHAAAVTAFTATTSDAYPLKAGALEATLKPYLSAQNPEAAVRVPARGLHSTARRLKWRAGHADCNPYLSLAAALAAGIDGVRNSTEPALEKNDSSLPGSLEDALNALDADRKFLNKAGFDNRLIDSWIADRRSNPKRSAIEG